jgi:sugar/nucleoside kinase (ribokinase family)
MERLGLFVGLTTLDVIYRVAAPPTANQKIVASDTLLAAGGPATNAAIAFQYLGNPSMLLSVVGGHPLSQIIHTDLQACQVAHVDLQPNDPTPPPTSSILVTEATGDRAVVSMNAVRRQASTEAIPPTIQDQIRAGDVDIVLMDGHQMDVGEAIATLAKDHQVPVVIDAGSWKPGFERVLPLADVVIASANFYPPDCTCNEAVFAYLRSLQIPKIAISRGGEAIQFHTADQRGQIPIPQVKVVDTLGAGDILHGAFCHFYPQFSFPDALEKAAAIASRSCQFLGTRQWIWTLD